MIIRKIGDLENIMNYYLFSENPERQIIPLLKYTYKIIQKKLKKLKKNNWELNNKIRILRRKFNLLKNQIE